MDLFLVLVLPLASASAFPRWLRPGVVGLAYLGIGFAVDLGFRVWVAGWAGRAEMGGFAILESFLFGLGLVGTWFGLVAWPRPTRASGRHRLARALAWLGWWLLIPATGYTVLNRLPP